jgi:hypothetical protein
VFGEFARAEHRDSETAALLANSDASTAVRSQRLLQAQTDFEIAANHLHLPPVIRQIISMHDARATRFSA